MEQKHYYNTITSESQTEFKDRGSKFIGYSFPIGSVNDFKLAMDRIKKEHPKATHHCFAYRLGNDGNQFRVSDDGEPSGTAGRPILGQIDSKLCTNILIVVVRYFGGTQLGVPGLINAYKTTASLVLQVTPIVQKQVEISYSIEFDYTAMNDVMQIIKQMDCTILEKDTSLFCKYHIGIPSQRVSSCIYKLEELRSITIVKNKLITALKRKS
jgi:uncharacterized YigZ family protein